MLRSLVVNADDLGLTAGVNKGIFDAHDRGVVTSTSMFANAFATTHALAGAVQRPSLGVGCHLTLVDGRPALPPACPPIFAIVTRLADRFRIPVVRVPFEWSSNLYGDTTQRRTARSQAFLNAALLPWAWRDYRRAAQAGVRTPHFIGRTHTGVLSAQALAAMVRALPPGVTELMVHPGYVDETLARLNTRLLDARANEVHLLTDASTFDLLIEQRIGLICHDLSRSEQRGLRRAS